MERKTDQKDTIRPYCVMEIVQGKEGVDARQLGITEARRMMLEHLIASVRPLHEAGWGVALRRIPENQSLQNPYFRPDMPYFGKFHAFTETFYYGDTFGLRLMALDTRNRLVKRILNGE